MKRLFILVTSAVVAASLIAACGQRGPLVMPAPESRQPDTRQTTQPKPAPSPVPTSAPPEKPKQ